MEQYKKSNIYTRGGDSGSTSLVGGTRVAKNDTRLEAYGTVDELNSWIGLVACADALSDQDRSDMHYIQNRLFDIGSALATEAESSWQPEPFGSAGITRLEQAIDRLDSALPRHNRFILPGGCPDSARTQIARTVARRAERQVITLSQTVDIDRNILRFINRLSDYLFVVARAINIKSNIDEIFWEKNC